MSVPLGPRAPAGAGPAWARWRPPVSALLLSWLAAGCAGARQDPPLPVLTAAAHEQAAEAEERRAVQAGQASEPGGSLSAEAARHRQAAAALLRAVEDACPAPALESEGVFSLVSAVILDVQPLEERTSAGPPQPNRAGPPTRLAGAVLRVSTLLPKEDAAAGLECQVARARVNGGIAGDPLAVPGVHHRVSAPTFGVLRVELHSDDEVVALEVLRRARALAAH